jgi:hypothetical protein
MALSGNLRTMLPGDLLQWLSLGQKTGTLVISNQRVEKKIFFRNGRVISSASNDPREYLGQFLMSHGYITEPELKKAMEVQQQSGILLGKILVMIDHPERISCGYATSGRRDLRHLPLERRRFIS